MYLKSLEIHGFKSFPDKIRLDFDKGITAVVGPNGSGKSNIGDAVRWVLGEQSSKTLRGAKMEDVIFAGTQLRRPMGFASVTLCIVNTGELDTGTDEVFVTRKLYRSGESEYLINGAQVRLKDISELFMDTGLGRDGYSIVGQGKVAEIVSSKSAERRSIFEEAAGISRSRYRKEDAQNRLEKAEENIVRLEDILRELADRVGPLKEQSEKAEKFVVLAERRKALEVTVWINRIDEIGARISQIGEQLLVNEAEHGNAQIDIKTLEDREQEISKDLNLSNIAIERLQGDIMENQRTASDNRSKAAVLENDISHANEKIAELEKRTEEAKAAGSDSVELIRRKTEELREAQSRIKASEQRIMELQDELLHTDERSGELDSVQNSHEQKLNGLYIRRTELNTTISASQKSLDDAREADAAEQKRLTELKANMSALEGEKEQVAEALSVIDEKIAEEKNRLAGTKKLYEGKAAKLSDIQKKASGTEVEIRVRRERSRILNDLENAMEGYSNASKTILRAAKNGRIKGVCGTVSGIMKIAPEYSTAIETALGAAIQNIVTENEDTAKRGIELLKKENAGRATFLPLTSVKGNRLDVRGLEDEPGFVAVASDIVECDSRYEGVVRSLLGRVAIAESIDYAGDIARKNGYKFRIVTLDGQVVNAGGSYTGGSVNRSSGILTRKNEIERISSEIEALEAEARKYASAVMAAKDECERLSINIAGIEDELSAMQTDKVRFESESKRIEELSGQIMSAQTAAEESAKRLRSKNEEVEESVRKNKALLDEVTAAIEEALLLSSDNLARREELRREREASADKLSQEKISLAQLRMDCDSREREITDLERRCEEMGDLTARYTLDIEDQNRLISELREQIEKLEAVMKSDSDESERLVSEIAGLKAENMRREQEAVKLRSDLKEANRRREELVNERTRLEERRSTAQNEQDRIVSDMVEQYDIYPSDAREIIIPDADIRKINSELQTVRGQIKALGNVNLAAIEEYKEVSVRYNELHSQLSDVNRSKRELERLIEELTLTMETQFKQSFDRINESFKKIFTELFGGGRADLSLSDPDNVLESGIDIKVAPPGKVIGNLSLLSGGEQAFVAIAIYFAILRIRPAPFCILDEIEAALDDVNVSRYAQYLHNFTDTTQFITITHRRGTMEEADVFYGVTMQEKGISRLLKMEQGEYSEEG